MPQRDILSVVGTITEAGSTTHGWVATSYGTLDVTGHDQFTNDTDILVVPTVPGTPLALQTGGTDLWRRLIAGPVADSELTEAERAIVREMAETGIASDSADDPHRVYATPQPWLFSPMHELVYALIQKLASEIAAPIIFIKGPVLRAQGLREKDHSGDVDVWVAPDQVDAMCEALSRYGWTVVPHNQSEALYHSVTVRPPGWGCEIDIHYRFPGINHDPEAAFVALTQLSEVHTFAGVEANAPGRAAHAVIRALHEIRPLPERKIGPTQHDEVVRLMETVGPAVIDAAVALRALDVLRDDAQRAFPQVELPADGGGIPPDWQWRAQPNRAKYHLTLVRNLPWLQRPRALAQALWPDDRRARGSALRAGDSTDSLTAARFKRILRGVRQLWTSK